MSRKAFLAKPSRYSPELTRWKECVGPLLDVKDWDVESWRDDTGLVESSSKVHDDLSSAVVIDDFEFSDVAVLHHDCKEFNHDLRVGSDENLALSALLGIVDALEGVCENRNSYHAKKRTET